MPDGVKKIGDAKMADAVVDAFVHGYGPVRYGINVEGFGLTEDQCVSFGINQNVNNNQWYDNYRCDVLRDTLNNGKLLHGDGKIRDHFKGQITPEEKDALKDFDFSDDFIERLAGHDGARPLKEQLKFFGEWCVTEWLRVDANNDMRARMIRDMGMDGGVYAVPYIPKIIEAFEEAENADIKYEAALALKRLLPFVEDGSVKKAAKVRIDLFREQEVTKLIDQLKNDKEEIPDHFFFGEAVGEIGGVDSMPQLIDLIRNNHENYYRSWQYKECLTRTFKTIGDPAIDELVKLLEGQNDNPNIRVVAANFLGALPVSSTKTIMYLIDALFDDDAMVRSAVATALMNIGSVAYEAAPFLEDMASNDPDQQCRQAAKQALEKMLSEIL